MRLNIGAHTAIPAQRFTIYLPGSDRNSQAVSDIERWIEEVLFLLTDINGGATRLAPAMGIYRTRGGEIVRETTHIVYSNIDPGRFAMNQGAIRDFIQRFVQGTDQESVLVEFDGALHSITVGPDNVVPFPIRGLREEGNGYEPHPPASR